MTVVVGASLTSDEEAYDNLMRHGGKGSIAEIGRLSSWLKPDGVPCEEVRRG